MGLVSRAPAFDLRAATLAAVAPLFAEFHAYRSTGRVCTYAFAVIEDGAPVAAFLWQPPPPPGFQVGLRGAAARRARPLADGRRAA